MRPRLRPLVVMLAVPALWFSSPAGGSEPAPLRCFPPPQPASTDQPGIGYVHLVRVGTARCEDCPPQSCRGDSVQVLLGGGFPDGCSGVVGFREEGQDVSMPTLRVDIRVAGGGACPDVATSFCTYLRLRPGFAPRGSFRLRQVVTTGSEPAQVLEDVSTLIAVDRPFPCPMPPAPILPNLRVALDALLPGPFSRGARLAVSLPEAGVAELTIHDVAGRRLATVSNGLLPEGVHEFTWDASGAAHGVYFARLRVGGLVLAKRVLLLGESR